MSIKQYIAQNLKTGKYKLLDNESGTSSMWSIYAMIGEENGSVLDGFIYCRQCKELIKYGRKFRGHAYHHKCFTKLKANESDDGAPLDKGKELNSVEEQSNAKHNETKCLKAEEELLEDPPSMMSAKPDPCQNEDPPAKRPKLTENSEDALCKEEDMLTLNELENVYADDILTPAVANDPIHTIDFEESLSSEAELLSIIKIEESVTNDTIWEESDPQLNHNEEDHINDSSEIQEKLKTGIYKLVKKIRSKGLASRFFYQIVKDDGKIVEGYVSCRECKSLLKFHGSSTSNLHRHKCYIKAFKSGGLMRIPANNKEAALTICTDLIVQECQPCNLIEAHSFRNMLNFFIKLGANYGERVDIEDLMPDSKALTDNIHVIAEARKALLQKQVQKVYDTAIVTAEFCPDYYVKRNFLSVWLHYNNNYELNNIHLGIKSCNIKISFQDMSQKVDEILTEFGVCNVDSKVFISDTPSVLNNDHQSSDSTIICSYQLFSTVLNTAIDRTVELQEVITDCKTIIEYIRKNPIEMLKIFFWKTQCGLNYTLIKSITENWQQLQEVLGKSDQPLLPSERISILNQVVQLFHKFEVIFKKLQASRSPSLCFVIPSINIIKKFCATQNNEDLAVSAFKKNILSSLKEIWLPSINIWHKAAFFLYPLTNKEQTNDLNEIKAFCIEQIIKREQKASNCENSVSTTSDSSSTATPTSTKPPSNESDFSEDISFFFLSLVKKSLKTAEYTPADEVTRYATDFVNIDETFNGIHWWQKNSANYPGLSKLALRILSIPASKPDIQREFALARTVITEKFEKFTPQAVNNILFLNCIQENNI